MKQIRVVKNAKKTEDVYLDFAQKVGMHKDGKMDFDYDLLQFLFQYADYNEIDFEKSDIHYSEDEEKIVDSTIALKSGMLLMFTRERVGEYEYHLKSMNFLWKEYKYTYSYPTETENERYQIAV